MQQLIYAIFIMQKSYQNNKTHAELTPVKYRHNLIVSQWLQTCAPVPIKIVLHTLLSTTKTIVLS